MSDPEGEWAARNVGLAVARGPARHLVEATVGGTIVGLVLSVVLVLDSTPPSWAEAIFPLELGVACGLVVGSVSWLSLRRLQLQLDSAEGRAAWVSERERVRQNLRLRIALGWWPLLRTLLLSGVAAGLVMVGIFAAGARWGDMEFPRAHALGALAAGPVLGLALGVGVMVESKRTLRRLEREALGVDDD